MADTRPFLMDFDLQWRGWAFPAVTTDADDPNAVCKAEDADEYLAPEQPDQWRAWLDAGQPRDEESLRRYGFVYRGRPVGSYVL